MITIRKYKQEDKEFVRKICMDTAKGSFAVKPKKREAVAKMYIDYNIIMSLRIALLLLMRTALCVVIVRMRVIWTN